MNKFVCVTLLFFIFLTGCSNVKEPKEEDQEASILYSEPEVIVEMLNVPWSIDKEESAFYLSERPGSIVKVEDGKWQRQKIDLEKKLAMAAEAGLLGFVLAPEFSKSNEAYAYYTYQDNSGQFNRIVNLQLEGDKWRENKVLLDRIPSGEFHHGGRLEIGPDNKLYATTGDASSQPEIAQDLESLGGKILRMNLDGSVPEDNPFPNSYVYSYGHRNPQGLTWSNEGTLYESEHGPSANDEINQIEPGHNYGWPIIKGNEEKEGMETPLFTSGKNATWAPSGMAYYDGKLYVAALRGNAVLEFNLHTGDTREVIKGFGRIRDVFIEDNSLYFISNNTDGRGNPLEKDDKLYRIFLKKLN